MKETKTQKLENLLKERWLTNRNWNKSNKK